MLPFFNTFLSFFKNQNGIFWLTLALVLVGIIQAGIYIGKGGFVIPPDSRAGKNQAT